MKLLNSYNYKALGPPVGPLKVVRSESSCDGIKIEKRGQSLNP